MKAKVKTWLENVANGKISNYTEEVLKCVARNETISMKDLREWLAISHQTLTSCLSNLHDEGLIKVVGQEKKDNRYYSIYAYISNESEREHTITLRRVEKYIQWLKKAETYKDLMSDTAFHYIRLESKQFTFPN